jgi:hypothetical protein
MSVKKGVMVTNARGRPHATRISNTRIPLYEIADKLQCNPFEILCRFALGDAKGLGYSDSKHLTSTAKGELIEKDIISPELRIRAAAEAAAYLHPKLKAIEHSGEVKNVHVEKLSAIEVKSILANDPFLNQKQVEHGAIREPRAESAVPGNGPIEGRTGEAASEAGSD